MAKDGTNRGGARAGAGRKPKASDKANIINFDKEGTTVRAFLTAKQSDNRTLLAKEIYDETLQLLKDNKADKAVNIQLVEQYSMSVARWIQCEEYISKYGFFDSHPTTGAKIASPIINISMSYLKQANQIWYQISQTIKEFGGSEDKEENNSPMAILLKSRMANNEKA